MKFFAFASAATAFVIPDASIVSQLVLAGNKASSAVETFHNAVDAVASGVDAVGDWLRGGIVDQSKTSNLTLYQLIANSNITSNFTALVNEFPDVVAVLNATSTANSLNHTLFVPVDTAFAALPGGGLTEYLPTGDRAAIVHYHIGLGGYRDNALFTTNTLPTLHHESLLGGAPQRLRVRFENQIGVLVNFAARIIAPNIVATNGVLHGLDAVLVPPSFVGRQLSLVPDHYSTLLHAMQASNFTQYIHGLTNLNGSTVLAPSNEAFRRLGPQLNGFLFHTPRGLKYLYALLRYQTVPNATVYSDAFYGSPALVPPVPASAVGADGTHGPVERIHYQLPTLLGNATLSIDIMSVPGSSVMVINNNARVSVQDGVAKNGVIQELERVVFPPSPSGIRGNPSVDPPVKTVADVVARLGPYVDDDGDSSDPTAEL
ncbi:hypothetical protein HMPREF1624_02253 [Sporothrix schenckii ATCC 58251]|uniref:FAS1 domain-containing protein n=1 Tax=Sporothrix schenckii (strain ATCC 58251 / de Perez 2211183) TaxID=1391915 RepID=U7Q1H3_SPOS1|nr:hypothetical protein HMPREF1624_02253 [Sporothrix schenckii ATCC 58251]